MTNAVVFLSDGDTWTTIDGCSICILTDKQLDYLSISDKRPDDLDPIMEISLGDCTKLEPVDDQPTLFGGG